jgi:DNA relaxase NicK
MQYNRNNIKVKERKEMNKQIEKIAKEVLNIETLEERKSDSLDFYEISVWGLKEALERAYQEGVKSVKVSAKG